MNCKRLVKLTWKLQHSVITGADIVTITGDMMKAASQ